MATIHSTNQLKQTNESKLGESVYMMDCMAQSGLAEIVAISKMALHYMEQPQERIHMETLAQALKAIATRADDTMNSITCEAESVGHNYTDAAEKRRMFPGHVEVQHG